MSNTHLPRHEKGVPSLRVGITPQLTSFVGRNAELAEVQQLLAASRLVTLTGMGGSGKTRLALHAAGKIAGNFAHGTAFLQLSGLSDEGLVPQLVVQGLGIPQAGEKTSLESLLSYLQSRQMLLLLDNCEHLVMACARMVEQILENAPAVSILATSREPLGLLSETICPIVGLTYPTTEAPGVFDLQDMMAYDAVRLFVERVQRTQPAFSLTQDNARHVLRICQRLDGIPLALELASARGNVLTMGQIARRLDDRFSLLVSRSYLALEPRHSTLRAAIDWSYDLLSPAEQALLRRISVFASGCSLASIESVCVGSPVETPYLLDLLSSLVEKSLVIAHTLQRSEARYQLLETIRQYAQEKLVASEEYLTMLNRHLDYYVGVMEETTHKLTGPYQQLWLSWLDDEYNDVRQALGWSLESQRIEAGLRLGVAIYQYWVIRDYAEEGLAWLERLLSHADEQVSRPVVANALAYAAFLAGFRGKKTAQMAYGRQAAELAEIAGESGKPALRWALSAQAYGRHAEGDFQGELDLYERATQLSRETGNVYELGVFLSTSSFAAMALGKYDVAQAKLEESLPLLRQAGNPYRIGMALNFLGDLMRCQVDYPAAKDAYVESISILREIDAVRDLASVLHNLAYTYLHLSEWIEARELFDESLSLQLAQGNQAGIAECLAGYAALAATAGFPGPGRRLLAAAVTMVGEPAFSSWAATRLEYQQTLALLHARLSEQEFDAEGVAGRVLSLNGAVALARSLPKPESKDGLQTLTRREREIVELVAKGMPNGEIAEALVVSKRTVEKHIAHILRKLRVSNRSQIVLWAIEKGLVNNTLTDG